MILAISEKCSEKYYHIDNNIKLLIVYMLVDAGFDVWLGNARGTRYSLEHVSLPSNSKRDLRYWDFRLAD